MKWQVDVTSWHLTWWTWLNEICSRQLSKEKRWKSFRQNKLECFLTDNHFQPSLTFMAWENRLQAKGAFTFAQGCVKMFTRLTVPYYYLGSLGIIIIIILKWNNFCCLNTQETGASIGTVSVACIFFDANAGTFAIGHKYWTRRGIITRNECSRLSLSIPNIRQTVNVWHFVDANAGGFAFSCKY